MTGIYTQHYPAIDVRDRGGVPMSFCSPILFTQLLEKNLVKHPTVVKHLFVDTLEHTIPIPTCVSPKIVSKLRSENSENWFAEFLAEYSFDPYCLTKNE